MSEWNYDLSDIEIDTPFLACLHSSCVYKHITILTKRKDEKYENQFGDVYEECEITAWMPLPDMPEKKHSCQDENIKCYKTEGKIILLNKKYTFDGEDLGWFEIGEYNFCPICGEKSDDIKDADEAHSRYLVEGGTSLEEVKKTIS